MSSGDLLTALQSIVAMVDQMDRSPANGGGVLPIDKAQTMRAARFAIARAQRSTSASGIPLTRRTK